MLSTANHLQQVKKIKIKEDQLVGLKESYDVRLMACSLSYDSDLPWVPDRLVSTQGSIHEGIGGLFAKLYWLYEIMQVARLIYCKHWRSVPVA